MSDRHIARALRITSCAALILLAAGAAFGQMQIKVNDNVNVKFGVLLQSQLDATQDISTRHYAQNVFVRRVRLLVGGQIAPNITFFAETDSPNLGKSLTTGTKNSQPQLYLQDAYVEFKFNDKFALDAGLMLPSVSRNGLQSAASLMPIDYGPHTFAYSSALQTNVGRDTGLQAKGYVGNKRLEYRVGVFQGMRDSQNRELRTIGRVQYNFFDVETGFFYTGTYLGKKKILAIGGGVDRQHKYTGYAADLFYDRPLKGGNAVTFQVDTITYDGRNFLKSLPKQNDTLVELGFLVHSKFMPYVQAARRNYSSSTLADENRVGAGINYFLNGHNANIKAGVTRVDVDRARTANQLTLQVQFFYF